LAFTTQTGSNGVTSLVGTPGVDIATIVTLNNDVFIGAEEADDIVVVAPGTGDQNLEDWEIIMGGGDDRLRLEDGDNLLNSFVQLDGKTSANDGDDIFNADVFNVRIIGSEVRALGGKDSLFLDRLDQSTINGNLGDDLIDVDGGVSNSEIMGGKDNDRLFFFGNPLANTSINGNKGIDNIVLTGFSENTTVFGGQNGDFIRVNEFAGDSKDLVISGDKGADELINGLGDATILGGDDADTIQGGLGADTLTGGAGADVFNYFTIADSTISGDKGFDVITDFGGGDKFDVNAFAGVRAIDRVTLGGAGSTLEATLQATIAGGNSFAAAGQVARVIISDAVSFAGSYLVIAGGAGNFAANLDAVIKMDTGISGISNTTFI